MNVENIVTAEKGCIRLLKQGKLAYHQCLNEIEGGGYASAKRDDLPKGALYGVYLCYNLGGLGAMTLNIEKVLSGASKVLKHVKHALETSSFLIDAEDKALLRSLRDVLQRGADRGYLVEEDYEKGDTDQQGEGVQSAGNDLPL